MEIPQQAVTEDIYFLGAIALRIEIAAATITTTTTVVHVPDGNTECRDEIGCDIQWDALAAILLIEKLEVPIENFDAS